MQCLKCVCHCPYPLYMFIYLCLNNLLLKVVIALFFKGGNGCTAKLTQDFDVHNK